MERPLLAQGRRRIVPQLIEVKLPDQRSVNLPGNEP